ncbi:MAG: 5'-methylthioadenosine/adenosylhomocysteine nucleosidase [Clostridia bacterium]|nr:5'-methylthioadenosine/adenosylhomocysteine nucleosidase [Clostridia bacterium]
MGKTTAIICAMTKEAETLIGMMTDKTVEKISGREYIKGKLCGKDVVIVVCGIGKVLAASCAQTMILKYSPDVVINTGVAGSLDEHLKIYDIVIASHVVQHDFDTSVIGDPLGYIAELDTVKVQADDDTNKTLARCAEKLRYNYVEGVVATGDQFIDGAEKKAYIKANFGASACDMEGAAIGTVCRVAGVKFAVLRSISDSGDGVEYSSFVVEAVKRSTAVIKEYLLQTK